MKRRRRVASSSQLWSAFVVGFRFPLEVILLAVRWYLCGSGCRTGT
jgi:hypothetical protein